ESLIAARPLLGSTVIPVADARVPSLRNRNRTQRNTRNSRHSAENEQKVEVRRSPRRRRTVTAYRDGDTMVVLIPATMTKAEEKHWVAEMQRKLQRAESRRTSPARASD